MALFSERIGYVDPKKVIVRKQITEPVLNSIINWLDIVYNRYSIFHSEIFDREKIDQLYISSIEICITHILTYKHIYKFTQDSMECVMH